MTAAAPPVNGNGLAKMGTYAAIFMAFVTILSAFIWIGSIASEVSSNGTAITEMRSLVERIDQATIRDANAITRLQSANVEIETQFCGEIQFNNQQHARDLRDFAALYERVSRQRLPTDNAYYRECNRPPTP